MTIVVDGGIVTSAVLAKPQGSLAKYAVETLMTQVSNGQSQTRIGEFVGKNAAGVSSLMDKLSQDWPNFCRSPVAATPADQAVVELAKAGWNEVTA